MELLDLTVCFVDSRIFWAMPDAMVVKVPVRIGLEGLVQSASKIGSTHCAAPFGVNGR